MTTDAVREHEHRETRSLWQRFLALIRPRPETREDLLDTLSEAEDQQVIGAESRIMLEGVLRMADLTAGNVMVDAPRMDLINIHDTPDQMLHQIIDTAHSRFPVFEGERDNIIGLLHAKDLLKMQRAPELNVRTLLRPPSFIPESKKLNDLLRDFRNNRNHMAIVVDEFGHIAGLVTIEDVLEQIVGEIEDEFDLADDGGDIFALADQTYRISGDTPLENVIEALKLNHLNGNDEDVSQFSTVGGYIAHVMGHVPRRGEVHILEPWRFEVMHTRAGAVKWFKVMPADRSASAVTK
ncbi:MAG: hypothetical protein RLZZ24_996 [Pseudomonadota bacterium]